MLGPTVYLVALAAHYSLGCHRYAVKYGNVHLWSTYSFVDLALCCMCVQVLTNLAAWPEGHRALLKSGAAPGLLELLTRTLSSTEGTAAAAAAAVTSTASDARQHQGQQDQAANHQSHVLQLLQQLALRNACLALLRNLCFAAEAKSHLLAHPGVLPALVAAAEGVGDNPAGAAFAASGLWALAYQGEKVRRTPQLGAVGSGTAACSCHSVTVWRVRCCVACD